MAGVNIIPSLDPWADVWEKTGTAIGEGLMTGYKKAEINKELEGLDWNDPQSFYKVADVFRQQGDYDSFYKWATAGSNLETNLAKALASAGGKTRDIPQPTDVSLTRIQEQLDKKFDFGEGLWGVFDLGQDVSSAWEGYDRVGMSDWVFGYSQKFDIDPQTVINKIAKGELKPEDIGTGYTAPTGGTALTSPVPPAPSFKY